MEAALRSTGYALETLHILVQPSEEVEAEAAMAPANFVVLEAE